MEPGPFFMRISAVIISLSALFLAACLEDRSFPDPVAPGKGTIRELKTGSLIINEIYAEGAAGTAEPYDWIELYNPSDSAVLLETGRFFASDAPGKKGDYSPSRNYFVPGKGFLWIAFQNGGQDTSARFPLNPKASLSASGEFAGIWFRTATGDTIVVDSLHFPSSTKPGHSFGSLPDGNKQRFFLPTPSRGSSNNGNPLPNGEPSFGRLVINEIDPNGSPDWAELANPFPQELVMKAGQWFFTDDTASKEKYMLPVDFVFPGNAYRTLECATTGTDADASQLRAKFSLSSNGEHLAIYFKRSNGDLVLIAEQAYPAGIPAGQTYGRSPNLSGPFQIGLSPTPGAANP
jgi:hypothetical protein